MPKPLEDLVAKLLADPDFYPKKKPDERKSLAYAIANKQLNKKKSKESDDDELIEDGALNLSIDIIETQEKFTDETQNKLYGVIPIKKDSLMIVATVQSDVEKYGEYMVTKECIKEGLPALEKAPNNVVFSSHRHNDEYAIGLTRKIKDDKAVMEIFRGTDDHIGKTIASGIETGRIKYVSSGFQVLEQECGICGQIGKPYLKCGHYPGEEEKGKKNIVKIKKAQYMEISTTPRGADKNALIIHAENICRFYSNDEKMFKKTEVQKHIQQDSVFKNNRDETKMSQQTKESDSQSDNSELEKLKSELEELKKKNTEKDSSLEALKNTNKDLSKFFDETKKKELDEKIKKAIEIRENLKLLNQTNKNSILNYLKSLSEEQLDEDTKIMEQLLSKDKKETKPIHPDVDGNQKSSYVNLNEDEYKLRKFADFLKEKAKKKTKGGAPYEPVGDRRDMPHPEVEVPK